jgi:proteasome component ECM29
MPSDAAAQLLASLAAIAAGGAGVPGGASGGNVRHEEADGATTAVGYILAQAAAGAPALPAAVASDAAASLLTAAGGTDEALCATAAAALGHAGLRAPLPLPEGEAPAEPAPPSPGTTAAAVAAAAAAVVIPPTRAGVATRVALLLKSKDPKTVVRAARAAGHLAAGDAACAPLVAPLTAALLACGTIKTPTTEAVTFAVGDALAAAFAGMPPSAIDAELRRGGTAGARAAPGAESDASADDEEDEEDGGDAMDAEADAAATAAAAAAAAASEAPARAAAQASILSTLLGPMATSSRPAERCAAAVWLLSLVGAAGADTASSAAAAGGSGAAAARPRCHPALAPRLAECQEAFSYLLGDANEVTQDCASRGLSLVYRRGDAATRKALVGGLVATLSGDKAPAKRAVKARGDAVRAQVLTRPAHKCTNALRLLLFLAPSSRACVQLTDDTEVFAAGTLGEAPASAGGGGLSTYKARAHTQAPFQRRMLTAPSRWRACAGTVRDGDGHGPAGPCVPLHGPGAPRARAEHQARRRVRLRQHRAPRRRCAGAAHGRAGAQTVPHAARPKQGRGGRGIRHLGRAGV